MRDWVFMAIMSAVLLSSCATTGKRDDPAAFDAAPLLGMAYDSEGSPVQGVRIALDGIDAAESDLSGRFVVSGVTRGAHIFGAARDGYEPIESEFLFLNRSQVLYLRMHSADQLLSTAERALEAGNVSEAEDALTRAGRIDGVSRPVLLYLEAISAWNAGKAALAAEKLEELAELGFDGPEVTGFLTKVQSEE